MPIGPDDASYVLDLAQQERYVDAYRYMAAQIRIDPSWDASLADWADRAADINGSEPNFWKDWVFTFNANAAGKEPTNPETIAWNQEISDELARKALNDFIEAADNGLVLSPTQLYQRDVVEAVDQAGNPTWAWAGGPLGKLFGFPMGDTYDSVDDYQSWIVNALKTIGNLPHWYVSYAADFVVDTIADYWDFAKDIGANFDTSKWLDELGDLLRHFRSDPLVLDLDGDGVTLTALSASNTRFDIDGDGAVERVGWVGPNDGLLVLDANQNGQVDGIDELIGNTHVDGFDELASLDSNADGKIDQLDADFSKLLVWRDVNGDGVSSSSELLTTAQAGILDFKLAYTASGAENGGNLVARLGSYTLASGTQRAMASVQFAKDETVTRPTLPPNADLGEIATLPNLGGYGPMADLRTSMYHDQTLKDMVLDLVTEDHDFDTFKDFLDGGFMDILYRWAGIDLHAPGETSASLKEKLIEALTGESLFALSTGQQARIDDVFNSIIGKFGVGFLVQAADRPANLLIVGLGDQLASLDPNDASYLDDVAGLTEAALSNIAAVQLPYDYLEKFASLSLDPTTGAVVGDFDAFAREFIKDQPSFNFIADSTYGPPPAPPKTDGFITGTITLDGEVPGPINTHTWPAWYEQQGSFLFNVAAAMGIGADYVKNVTGWQWLMSPAAEVQGTSGNDVLNVVVSTITKRISATSADGGTVYSDQSIQTRNQRLYGYEGNDELRGNDGVDTLIGGAGNDLLFGGSDSDMYVYSVGSGLDRITEESGADDAVFFSRELKQEDLRVVRITGASDLQLHFGDSSQGIILTNQVNMGNSAVERFSFVGVGPLDAGDIATIYLRTLTSELNDNVTGTAAGEEIYGLGGFDILSGLDGDDAIFGGAGSDTVRGGNGNDRLEGGAGHDVLFGDRDKDILTGGAGNDLLFGNDGDDTYVFNAGDGQDNIADDGNGNDTLQLGVGILPGDVTVVQADNGNDLVLLFAGTDDRITLNDTITNGGRRIERVTFANGTVWAHAELLQRSLQDNAGHNIFYGSYDSESLAGGAGNDTLYGRAGVDILTGGAGNDLLFGNDGDDTYVFNAGDGQDNIADDGNGNDTLQLGVGILPGDVTVVQADNGNDLVLLFAGTDDRITLNDTITNGGRRIERVTFANGTVWAHAELLQRSLQDNAGHNIFYGSYDSESLAGGAGNDTLYGRAGVDILTGGAGNDLLFGNDGDDTYVFNAGDGQDNIADDGNGNDTLQLGAGILPGDVTVVQVDNGNDLVLLFAGTDDRITLNDTITNGGRRIERVTFANGTVWTHAELLQRSLQDNGGHNIFYGSYDSESLAGGAGNDTLYGRAGVDILTGGAGNDLLFGNDGDDTYVFNAGDGQDNIADDGNGNDTLQLGAGILPGDVTVVQADNGNDLVLLFAGSDDRITLNDTITNGGRRIERVTFANGTVWTHANLLTLAGTGVANNLQLNGTSAAEILNGGAGDDVLIGYGGNDILIGGAGNDLLVGVDGNDTYRFNIGDGQDIVQDGARDASDTIEFGGGIAATDIVVTQGVGGNELVLTNVITGDSVSVRSTLTNPDFRIEQVRFADGTIWSHAELVQRSMAANGGDDRFNGSYDAETLAGGAGDDVLVGYGGNDILIGGAGNDLLVGVDGNDTYRFNIGDGQDIVQEGARDASDTIEFGVGIAATDIVVTQGVGGNELVLTNVITGDSVSIRSTLTNPDFRIEQVRFADGTIWSHAELVQRSMAANGGDDRFNGSYDAETLAGGAGDDVLVGYGGNDILIGGAGNDLLVGVDGNDTYRFNIGDGQDIVQEGARDASDTIEFGVGIAATDIVVTQGNAGNDLILTNAATGDRVTIQYTFTNPDFRIEQVRFADGTIWSHAELVQRSMASNGGNDRFSGSYDAETLTGGAGDDVLVGYGGNDILIGGAGNDLLVGVDGNDTYRFNIGDGQDIVQEGARDASDTIEFGAGIAATDIVVTQGNAGNDLILTNAATGDRVTIQYSITNLDYRIEQVRFADNTSWNWTQLVSLSQQPADGDDVLYGYGGADTLNGGSGNDQLYGADGNDTLIGGSGTDILDGGNGIDTIDYSYGTVSQTINLNIISSQAISSNDADTIINTENVIGGSSNDTVTGNAAANVLDGGGGDDRLTGGAGNDTIVGGIGTSDTAVFAGTQMSYTIATNAGVVTIADSQPSVDGNDGVDTVIGIEKAEFNGGIQIGIASPVILDLDGNGVSLLDNRRTKVAFDWDRNGIKNQTGWIGKGDGFLFIDRDGNGTVTNAGELSFTSDKEGAKSDLDGLRAFDSNGDGIFSSADDQFSQFKVWRDNNGNGRVDKKEILSLQTVGVASIELDGEAVNQSWDWGENITVNTGSFTRTNGTVGSFSDVALSFSTDNSGNASINNAASQLSEAMAGFWDGLGTAAFGKFEALAERRDNVLAVVRGQWR